MLIKIGDRGPQVAEVQKFLSVIGYDLVIDGIFGPKTKRSVKAFQKKARILNDGIVTQSTFDALKIHAAARRDIQNPHTVATNHSDGNLNINRNYRLSDNQYIKRITEKSQIYLHFTAGGPNARNVINFWESNQPRVATAFVIDGNGAIFECFNPDYWSYHLGVKGTNGRLDKASVGIEICAYGPLKLKNGEYFAWPENYSRKKIPANEVYTLPRGFRGFQHYHAFKYSQIEATERLCEHLIQRYNIPVQYEFDYSWFDYNSDVIRNTLPGIWSHTTVRKDKFDLYPDHRVLEMLNRLANKYGQ